MLTLRILLGAGNLYSETDTRLHGLLATQAKFSRSLNPNDVWMSSRRRQLGSYGPFTTPGYPKNLMDWFRIGILRPSSSRPLATHSRLLTHLRLEYRPKTETIWDGQDNDIDGNNEDYLNFFARKILGLKRTSTTSEVIFPALTSLGLGFISLKNSGKVLVHALDIRGISSLALHKCPGGGSLEGNHSLW